jgi:hypothetical protein
VNAIEGNLSCSTGTYGILCATCLKGYYSTLGKACISCAEVSPLHIVLIFIGLLSAAVFSLWWFIGKTTAAQARFEEMRKKARVRWLKGKGGVLCLLKQLLGFFQIVLMLKSMYQIPFPLQACVSHRSSFFSMLRSHSLCGVNLCICAFSIHDPYTRCGSPKLVFIHQH